MAWQIEIEIGIESTGGDSDTRHSIHHGGQALDPLRFSYKQTPRELTCAPTELTAAASSLRRRAVRFQGVYWGRFGLSGCSPVHREG